MMRQSTEVRLERAGAVIVRLILGAILMVVGFGFDVAEYREPPPTHTTHLFLWTGVALLGVLIAAGRYVFPVIQQVVVIAGQTNLPFIGGRRSTDPPAPPPTDSTPPGGRAG